MPRASSYLRINDPGTTYALCAQRGAGKYEALHAFGVRAQVLDREHGAPAVAEDMYFRETERAPHRSQLCNESIHSPQGNAWWPLKTHTLAMAAKGQKSVRVTIEPRVSGRVYETLQDGSQLDWGEVLAYNPGWLFSMEWLLGQASERATEVTVRFEARDDACCRVTLTHENWENIGDDAKRLRNTCDSGWIAVFEKGFGEFAGLA